jgi:hypothetical protein
VKVAIGKMDVATGSRSANRSIRCNGRGRCNRRWNCRGDMEGGMTFSYLIK